MKILFLDIDGVMVLDPHKGQDEGIHGHDPFYKPSVESLNHIISATNCEIVMTSGWRRFFDLEQIREIFQWNGVQKTPIAFTQDYNGHEKQLPPGKEIEMLRCGEIMSWLASHDAIGRFAWCAVDDMDLSFGLERFVRCSDNNFGLSYKGVANAVISILENGG
jgi:Swiss Army Knife RNA repair-like protein